MVHNWIAIYCWCILAMLLGKRSPEAGNINGSRTKAPGQKQAKSWAHSVAGYMKMYEDSYSKVCSLAPEETEEAGFLLLCVVVGVDTVMLLTDSRQLT